jgi:hypothetical protein
VCSSDLAARPRAVLGMIDADDQASAGVQNVHARIVVMLRDLDKVSAARSQGEIRGYRVGPLGNEGSGRKRGPAQSVGAGRAS